MITRAFFYKLIYYSRPSIDWADISEYPTYMNYQEMAHGGCRGFRTSAMTKRDNVKGNTCRLDGCRLDGEGDSPPGRWLPWEDICP